MKKFFGFIGILAALAVVLPACQEEIDWGNAVNNGSNSGTAIYTFAGAPNACTSPAINGIYQQGTALGAGDSIVISVNVDSIGTYNISTGTANSVVFTGSGTFTSTGAQTVTLHGAGTPQNAGVFSFGVGANGCSFPITFTPSGTTNPGASCVACEYFPYCDSMVYVYNDSSAAGNSTRTQVVHFESDSTFDGLTWKKNFIMMNGEQQESSFFNCNNGVVKLFTPGTVSAGGQQIPAFTITMLKSNEPVGTTWTDVLSLQGQSVSYVNTIVEKGISRTVRGVGYTDVIHVKTEVQLMGQVSIIEHRYYAKGIGLIEDNYESPMAPGSGQYATLVSYQLP